MPKKLIKIKPETNKKATLSDIIFKLQKSKTKNWWEGGSGWGTHVNPWLFHFNV